MSSGVGRIGADKARNSQNIEITTRFSACGGRGGIRTHEGLAPLAVFKTAALNHSATLPNQLDQRLRTTGRTEQMRTLPPDCHLHGCYHFDRWSRQARQIGFPGRRSFTSVSPDGSQFARADLRSRSNRSLLWRCRTEPHDGLMDFCKTRSRQLIARASRFDRHCSSHHRLPEARSISGPPLSRQGCVDRRRGLPIATYSSFFSG